MSNTPFSVFSLSCEITKVCIILFQLKIIHVFNPNEIKINEMDLNSPTNSDVSYDCSRLLCAFSLGQTLTTSPDLAANWSFLLQMFETKSCAGGSRQFHSKFPKR